MEQMRERDVLVRAVQKLSYVSAQAGLTEDEVIRLLASDIAISELLDHLERVLDNRMH